MTESQEELLAKNEELRRSLEESQELLRAIRSGEVDALIISRPEGEKVFTLEGADRAYRVLIEAMNDGAVTMTSDGTILYCNGHFAEMVKSSLEKVIGSSIYCFIPKDDQAAFRVLQQDLGREELTLRAEDESVLPVYISINSLRISESQEDFCVVVTDLTEQKRKEEMVAAERLARSIIEQATEAVVVCNEKGKIIRFSNSASRILGYDPSLQSFEELFDLHTPIGIKLSPVSEALHGEVLRQVEASFKCGDGTLFHILLNSGPLKGTNGKIIGCVVTLTDITERKRVEIVLKGSEQRYATTLSSIGDAVIATDIEGNITFINRVAEEVTGWTLSEASKLPAKAVFNIINEFTRREVDDPVTKVLESGMIVGLANHTILIRRDGTEVSIDDSGAPIIDENGNITGVVLVFRDITNRRQAEAKIKRQNIILNAINRVYEVATQSETMEDLGRACLDIVESITGSKFSFIAEIGPDGLHHDVAISDSGWELCAMYDKTGHRRHPGCFEIQGLYGRVIKDGKSLLTNDPTSHPDSIGVPEGHPKLTAFLGVPFIMDGRAAGMIGTANREGGYSTEDQEILEALTPTILEAILSKRAEESLKENQTILKTIIESTPDYISLKDREGRYVMMNSAAAESLNPSSGISEAEIIGKKDNDIFPSEVACQVMDFDRQVITSGEMRAYDQSFTIQDEPRFFSSIKSPFRDGEGNVAGVVSVSRDITDRKRMEDELRTQADLLDRAPVLIFDLDGKIVFWNTGAEEMYGWTAMEAKSKGIHDLLATEFPEPLADIKSEVMSTGHWKGEVSQLRRDGSRIYVASHWILYMDRQGKPTAILEVNNDITALKKAEEALREARDYLETLIDYANAPIIVWDESFNITRFNHAFERLTGLDAQDVLGKHLEMLFPESSKEDSLGLIRRTGYGERWDAVEIPILRTDGSVRTVLWNSANINGRDGTAIVATIAQGQDITERKQAEEGLIKARDELELKVRERTAELQNALEAAEESVRAKAAFLANMSHELRTPMNAVIGFSSLLLDENLTQDQREYIEGIRNGGEAQLAIIDDILEFSRSEKDKIELEHQPFSLKHLIDESLDMVATQAGKKGLNLSETINYGTPDTIIGDHGRMRQILVNLLNNSVKFTDDGDVSVSVSSKVVEGNEQQIFFEVGDTGIGIHKDKMNEIFEPFTQVERTLSRKRDGIGLGLAITKNLVELMGGKIWVESKPGEGSTFHVVIPAETIPGKHLDFEKMKDRGVASESLSGLKPMRILVAEDNPSNQKVLVEMLKRLGYRADAVADGKEVVQALERQDYDLVLMDLKMPEMDGITAAKVIREFRPENGPKIIAITAFALEGDREKCLEAGMDDYIAKPVQMRELAEVLKKNQTS